MTQLTRYSVIIDSELNDATRNLILYFTEAIAQKAKEAQLKYGYSDNWADPSWKDVCIQQLKEHLVKGDMRDVALYCAFMWYHDWQFESSKNFLDDEQ